VREKTITLLLMYFRRVRSPQEIFSQVFSTDLAVKKVANRARMISRNLYLRSKTSQETYFSR
jgi:hypothetical protein